MSRFIPPRPHQGAGGRAGPRLRRRMGGAASTASGRRATGRTCRSQVAMSPICDADGAVVAASAIIRPRGTMKRRQATCRARQLPLGARVEPRGPWKRPRRAGEPENPRRRGRDAGRPQPCRHARKCRFRRDRPGRRRQGCALAILDISLAHGESSAPLAERLKRAGTPFLVTSGHAALDAIGEAASEARAYLRQRAQSPEAGRRAHARGCRAGSLGVRQLPRLLPDGMARPSPGAGHFIDRRPCSIFRPHLPGPPFRLAFSHLCR